MIYGSRLTQSEVRDHTAKDEGGKKRQQNYESIEKAVVALSNTIPHPWAVVVKALCMGNINTSHCITINTRHIRTKYWATVPSVFI